MSRIHVCRPVALLLALVPGWGHLYLGREALGLALFSAWALGVFTLANALWLRLGSFQATALVLGGLATAAGLVYSVVDVGLRTSEERTRRLRRRCDVLLWEGMMHFLAGDYAAAEEKFVDCCRLDGLEFEAAFRAGVVLARQGNRALARRYLLRARRLDTELKWRWEIERQLRELDEGDPSRPEGPAGERSSDEVAGDARPAMRA